MKISKGDIFRHTSYRIVRPLYSSSYGELLEFIKSKKAVVNIKNADNHCFKWLITVLTVEKDLQRITKILKA